jgi:exonuclease VII small subunit
VRDVQFEETVERIERSDDGLHTAVQASLRGRQHRRRSEQWLLMVSARVRAEDAPPRRLG